MNWQPFDYFAATGFVCLGLAAVAFGVTFALRRAWWSVAGTLIATVTTFLFSVIYATVPGLAFLGMSVATVLATWMLFREKYLLAGILLLPFAIVGVFTAATVPLVVREETGNASLGDLDGDVDLDIILAKGRHWPLVNTLLLNDGTGHFKLQNLSEAADKTFSAPLADLDGDGDLDLVVGNDESDRKLIYLNDGKAHFTLSGTFGEADWVTRNVTLCDLNGDGSPDIIVANRTTPRKRSANYTCLNDGRGHFPSCRMLSTESAATIAAGDLNGDGAPDLVVPHRDVGQSWLFINDGQGGFDQKRPFGPANMSTRAVALGDLNGDGDLDIIVGSEAGGVYVYFNQGNATFSNAVQVGATTDVAYSIAVADINGDGTVDVVTGNGHVRWKLTATTRSCHGGCVAILLNDGSGRSFSELRVGDTRGAVWGLAIGDINGDGSPDIVAARSGAPSMVYLNSLSIRTKGEPAESGNLPWIPIE